MDAITQALKALESRFDINYQVDDEFVEMTGYMRVGAASLIGTCRVSRYFLEPHTAEFIERTLAEKLRELFGVMVAGLFTDYRLEEFKTDLLAEVSLVGVK